mmetsp:Transcript_50522/g.109678  ORF Transcript_50522/g.109678 Transcript_50522/m.109678 type:complete len:89 (-) Transcript_50522:1008-1274(-)
MSARVTVAMATTMTAAMTAAMTISMGLMTTVAMILRAVFIMTMAIDLVAVTVPTSMCAMFQLRLHFRLFLKLLLDEMRHVMGAHVGDL